MSTVQRAFEMVQGYLPCHESELDKPTPILAQLALVNPEAKSAHRNRLNVRMEKDICRRVTESTVRDAACIHELASMFEWKLDLESDAFQNEPANYLMPALIPSAAIMPYSQILVSGMWRQLYDHAASGAGCARYLGDENSYLRYVRAVYKVLDAELDDEENLGGLDNQLNDLYLFLNLLGIFALSKNPQGYLAGMPGVPSIYVNLNDPEHAATALRFMEGENAAMETFLDSIAPRILGDAQEPSQHIRNRGGEETHASPVREDRPKAVLVNLFDEPGGNDEFDQRLEEVMSAERRLPVEFRDNDALRAAIGIEAEPEEVPTMEVRDGFGCAIDSIVTLAKAWAADSLTVGKSVTNGHSELKRQLLTAIEDDDRRVLESLITAGFEWGYDAKTGVASLVYKAGQSLAFTKYTIEDNFEAEPCSLYTVSRKEGTDAEYVVLADGHTFLVEDVDKINSMKIPMRHFDKAGYLVAEQSKFQGAFLYHELGFAPGYKVRLDTFRLEVDVYNALLSQGAISEHDGRQDEPAVSP